MLLIVKESWCVFHSCWNEHTKKKTNVQFEIRQSKYVQRSNVFWTNCAFYCNFEFIVSDQKLSCIYLNWNVWLEFKQQKTSMWSQKSATSSQLTSEITYWKLRKQTLTHLKMLKTKLKPDPKVIRKTIHVLYDRERATALAPNQILHWKYVCHIFHIINSPQYGSKRGSQDFCRKREFSSVGLEANTLDFDSGDETNWNTINVVGLRIHINNINKFFLQSNRLHQFN